MKKYIQIGTIKPGNSPAQFDIAKLIKTRLLICANSGGGKSWLLRLIAEQLFGTMPVIIFDVEGEFATLRDKFDFVLVGPGGETPADCRSAKLVIEKLLELRASAVIDLSELDARDRHRYIRLAAEAAINAPKTLWRPTCFIFDEAHEFCPENGKGESEAKSAVLAFATKGRKRNFLAIYATQRLHKLALDCRAECLNRMIGMTFEPDDLKVAASILGISGKDGLGDFNHQMRTMEEGYFFGFGRALCLETKTIVVGAVQTRHGKPDATALKPPPTPDNIKLLLPKLADLPQLAEEKAMTEKELRGQIVDLKKQLRDAKAAAPVPPAPKVETKTEKVPVLKPEHVKLIRDTAAKQEGILKAVVKITARIGDDFANMNRLTAIVDAAQQVIDDFKNRKPITGKQHAELVAHVQKLNTNPSPGMKAPPAITFESEQQRQRAAYPPSQLEDVPPFFGRAGQGQWEVMKPDDELSPGEIKILQAIAQYPDGLKEEQISVLTGYRRTTRYEYLKALKRKQLIMGNGSFLLVTESGIAALGDNYKTLPTGEALIEHWRRELSGGELRIFEYAVARGAPFENGDELQAAVNMKRTSCYENLKGLVARHILQIDRKQYSLSSMFL